MSATTTDRAAQRRQDNLDAAREAGRRVGARLAAVELTMDQKVQIARVLGGRTVTARRSAPAPPLSPERTSRLSDPHGGV